MYDDSSHKSCNTTLPYLSCVYRLKLLVSVLKYCVFVCLLDISWIPKFALSHSTMDTSDLFLNDAVMSLMCSKLFKSKSG